MTKTLEEKNIVNDAILKDISEAVHQVKNGRVVIKIRNSQILETDITHENRFDNIWKLENGAGI